jgi:hypothetical protein
MIATRMNISSLSNVAYPARWSRPRYRFGQQVAYLDGVFIVTGMRWCVAIPGDELTPDLYEWRYELSGVLWTTDEMLATAPVAMCA